MLTTAQLAEAIGQMKVSCELAEANGYRPLSARSVLYELGYESEAQQILQHIYDGGFTYCLDHEFECSNGDPDNPGRTYPDPDVCYWGPDQLRSRLNSLFYPVSRG